jgi:IS30 family transposase
VDECARVGDREGDLIVGRGGRSAIGTLVDRASRYLRLNHLTHGHGAERVQAALGTFLDDLPEVVRWTLT